MPKRILILGLLYCLSGVLAIWSIIEGLFNDSLSINISALMLPVGMGLLRGRRSSLKWARVWVGIGYLSVAVGFVLLVIYPHRASVHLFDFRATGDQAVPYVIAMLVIFIVVLAGVGKLLRSQKSRAYCQVDGAGLTENRGNVSAAPDGLRNAAAYYSHRDAERRQSETSYKTDSENP
jgi:hypothetical protein